MWWYRWPIYFDDLPIKFLWFSSSLCQIPRGYPPVSIQNHTKKHGTSTMKVGRLSPWMSIPFSIFPTSPVSCLAWTPSNQVNGSLRAPESGSLRAPSNHQGIRFKDRCNQWIDGKIYSKPRVSPWHAEVFLFVFVLNQSNDIMFGDSIPMKSH